MSIAKINTAAAVATPPSGSQASSGSGNGLLIFAGLILGGWLVYEYVLKPMNEDKEKETKE